MRRCAHGGLLGVRSIRGTLMHQRGTAIGSEDPARRRAVIAGLALASAAFFDSALAAPDPLVPSTPEAFSTLVPDSEFAPADAPSKADYAARTRPDHIGRIIVSVMVNQRGPFQFALDTGANRSVLAPHLVTALGLHTDDGEPIVMNGVTGAAQVPTVLIDRISAGDLTLERQRFPVADALTNGIDGILGVDGLQGKQIRVDFVRRRIEIKSARNERPMGGVMRIQAKLRFGRLMVTDAYVDNVRVKAVIDTGSEYTLGNDALRAVLFPFTKAPLQNRNLVVVGETLATQPGERREVRLVKVGDILANRVDIVFGDFYVFKLWDLDTQPALVIGMDIIGSLESMVIDYARCEVQLGGREKLGQFARGWGTRLDSARNL
jgi:predicted aspartyl protease